MRLILRMIYSLFSFISRGFYKFIVMPCKKAMFKECGKRVLIARGAEFTYKNVSLGNDITIRKNALFICSKAGITVGDHSMIGHDVLMVTGEHRTDIPGRTMDSFGDDDKLPENDAPIIIEGDNYICPKVTILKGVTVGRGAIIGVGSVVRHDVPRYSLVAGVPAKVVRLRFSEEVVKKLIEEDKKNGVI